jgi:hypothetical protein
VAALRLAEKKRLGYYVKPLKPTLIQIFMTSARTAKKTLHFTITKINWLMLFKKIIPVYSENYLKPINTNCSVTHR